MLRTGRPARTEGQREKTAATLDKGTTFFKLNGATPQRTGARERKTRK